MLIRSIEHNDAETILALTLLLFTASALVGWLLLRLDRRIRRHKKPNPRRFERQSLLRRGGFQTRP